MELRAKVTMYSMLYFALAYVLYYISRVSRTIVQAAHKDGRDSVMCKCHGLIAILIAFSRCVLLIKDERISVYDGVSDRQTIPDTSMDPCLFKRASPIGAAQ